MHIALFCQVVDNFGDIGVCWRLARQWVAEGSVVAGADMARDGAVAGGVIALSANLRVTLWVDDLLSFQKICAAVDPARSQQWIEGVLVRHWQDAELADCDVVVEAFGCHLPPQMDAAMRMRRPKWINLEYLSAEPWVETCHAGASPQVNGLTKYFFFPGFTAKTGALLAERDLQSRRQAWLADEDGQAAFWHQLGWSARPQALLVSLFCYPHAPLAGLFAAWEQQASRVLCLVPHGVAPTAVADFFAVAESTLLPGARLQRGGLTLQIIPFVDQPAYDHLLWQCDLNIVRGEDSFVRAQWAARPFLWHIYPQQDEIHLEKLQAFLSRYGARVPGPMSSLAQSLAMAWNRGEPGEVAAIWPEFATQLARWRVHAANWVEEMAQNGNLADNLVQFIQKID